MKIIYQQFNKKLESTLVDFLRDSGHDVCLMESNELLRFLESFCELENISSEDLAVSCVIISVDDTKALDNIISILSSPYNYRRPRVILLSSLLTWAGRHHEEQIEGNASDFHSRVPAVYAAEQYLLENKFYSMAHSFRADVCILGIGLVYGRDGFDLENILSSLWYGINATNPTQILSLNKGKNKVPMIHIDDLSNLLLKLVECTALPSIFYPVTDKSNTSIDEIFNNASKLTRSKFNYSSDQAAVEAVFEDPNLFIWLGSFPSFKGPVDFINLKFASGLSKSFEIVWKEFLSSHNLLPCSIVIAGPPKSLKTKLAQNVAAMLELQYVEVINCVKYVLTSEKEHMVGSGEGGGSRSDSYSNIPSERPSKSREKMSSREKESIPSNIPSPVNIAASEATLAVKNKVLKALEAARAQADGGKSKSKTKVEEAIDPKTLIITDALCRSIPAHLVRQCVGATLKSDLACTRKGYVLDAWDWAVQGLGDVRQMMEEEAVVLPSSTVAEGSLDSEQRPGSSQNKSRRPSLHKTRSGVPTTGKSFADKSISALSLYPELLVELQCPDAVSTNRLLCALMSLVEGSVISPSQLNKMSKDNQAILKAFEVTQATYNTLLQSALHPPDGQAAVATLTSVPSTLNEVPEGEEHGGEYPASSHQGVVEIQRSGLIAVRRFDTANITSSSIDSVAYQLISSYVGIHGTIGWLKELPAPTVNAPRGSMTMSPSSKSSRKPRSSVHDGASTASTPLDSTPGMLLVNEITGGASVPGSVSSSSFVEMFQDEDGAANTTDHPSKEVGDSGRVGRLDHINKNLILLESKDQKSVMDHCNQYQRYLVVNVLPHLADGMVRVAREMPEDPILFMVNFLRERGVRLEEDTKANALEKFKDALSLAEEMDREILNRN